MGWINDPEKAAYNKIYKKTTTGCLLPMIIIFTTIIYILV